ncbi:hypothetical protein [Fibrella aquatilis]|uniref:DUF4384 domain-containing protein n=1 Tax=Fibrella aquatilis TaxID=2817059 RepID=A0A939JXZ4_9BACT|nr:hypothetical protein [Fibrella aquatilis]MBO0929813.1 hypothetical protein [Fibrella aquatilis]
MKTLYFSVCLCFAGFAANAQEVLTNQSVIAMYQAKVARPLIADKINVGRSKFDMTTNGLLELKSADVPESIMETMLSLTHPTDILTNDDVIRLYQAKLGRRLITQKIQAGPTRFDVSTDGMIQLKMANVPEGIIKIMMTSGGTALTSKPDTKTQARVAQVNYTNPSTERGKTAITDSERPQGTKKSNGPTADCATWNDKFTKKTVRASRVTLRGWKPGAVALNTLVGQGSANAFGIEDMEVSLIFRADGNDLTLVLYASKPGIHTMFVSSDKPLMLLMQDGSVLQFLPAESSESDYSWGSGYSMDSEMLMYYKLSPEQARLLSQKLVKEYRLNFYNRKFAEDKVNESRALQVRAAAQCLLN